MIFRSLSLRRSAAFTLVELLVVILIIAVLAAILVPAMTTVLRKGNQTTSVNNLHQWYTGFMGSVQDNDGEMPTDGSAPFVSSNDQAWYNRLPIALKTRPYSDFTVSNRPTFGTKSIWVNPGVPSKDQVSPAGYVFNYGYNDLLKDTTGNTGANAATVPLKLVRLQTPQAIILMGEKADATPNLNVTNVRAYFAGTDPVNDPDATANFLFCDGHVELVKRSDFTSVKATDATYLDNNQTNITWHPFGRRDYTQ